MERLRKRLRTIDRLVDQTDTASDLLHEYMERYRTRLVLDQSREATDFAAVTGLCTGAVIPLRQLQYAALEALAEQYFGPEMWKEGRLRLPKLFRAMEEATPFNTEYAIEKRLIKEIRDQLAHPAEPPALEHYHRPRYGTETHAEIRTDDYSEPALYIATRPLEEAVTDTHPVLHSLSVLGDAARVHAGLAIGSGRGINEDSRHFNRDKLPLVALHSYLLGTKQDIVVPDGERRVSVDRFVDELTKDEYGRVYRTLGDVRATLPDGSDAHDEAVAIAEHLLARIDDIERVDPTRTYTPPNVFAEESPGTGKRTAATGDDSLARVPTDSREMLDI